MIDGNFSSYFTLESTVALCPKCRTDLGLRTSFALANLWSMRGVPPYGGGFNFSLEFPCHRCGTILTYRYELAGLFALLALLPLMAQPLLPSFNLGIWAFPLWAFATILYLLVLAALFSYYARPMVANPPIEGEW